MKVRFVSHAGFLVEAAGRSMVCDPWTVGKAFNNGWALMSPPSVPDYARVDYIWVSHEHPDHLNFPTLKSIPEERRRRLVVLYQRHASTRVANSIRALGFTVRELPLYRWTTLDPGLEVYCGSVNIRDSFLAVRAEGHTLLNLNDCVLGEAQLRYIRREVGPVSVLFTQFSFANWVGNTSDETGAAAAKLQELRRQREVLRPDVTVPFASFVTFCNAENARMNAWANTPEAVERLGLDGIVFLYPGDEWQPGQRRGAPDAVARYMRDLEARVVDPTPPSVPADKVREATQASLAEFRQSLPRALLRTVDPFDIFLSDLGAVLRVDAAGGRAEILTGADAKPDRARFVMCSQVAWYSFHFSWGTNTTEISGMYLDRQHATHGWNRFFRFQNVLSADIFGMRDVRRWPRIAGFLWAKKWELLLRVLDRSGKRSESAAA